MMHYAIEVVPFGVFSNPGKIIPLAQAAEAAGWEGLFVWDHLGYVSGIAGADPWVILAAVAAVTSRLKLGVEISPLSRYRPHVLAQTLVSLDLLSQGRVIFGAGLGHNPDEFSLFGEPADQKIRAGMLDESLDVLGRLMAGSPVTHHGEHYTVDNVTLQPLPIQRPRIPIWIGGRSHPALRRAARWDGWVMTAAGPGGEMKRSPDYLAGKVEEIYQNRLVRDPFDIAVSGYSRPGEHSLPRQFESAGATWWLECLSDERGQLDELLGRIKAGPPDKSRLSLIKQ
jgi:alkanesulfonate monooxygenase SsuD/methylene tetrahydromethanopterin reductase-like flavin-dependent oxidoreductase (luciferase family)